MARRSKALRPAPTPVRPPPPTTPVPSTLSTPLSSAYPSAYPSEDESEDEPDDEAKREPGPDPSKGFKFLDLPAELRLRIYDYHFTDCRGVIDLEPENYKRIGKKLALFRVCKQLYHEVTPVFFSNSTFRVFPIHPGRPLKTKKPLLARLTPDQRSWITNLELRLGPGFNNPPRGWVINDALGLRDCVRAKKLRVYVEIDPSDNALKGFRRADGFYEEFSSRLLTGILAAIPSVEVVEFDAWPSVKISGGMMQRLLGVISPSYQLAWGADRGWNGATTGPESHDSDAGIVGFEKLALIDYIPA